MAQKIEGRVAGARPVRPRRSVNPEPEKDAARLEATLRGHRMGAWFMCVLDDAEFSCCTRPHCRGYLMLPRGAATATGPARPGPCPSPAL